MRQKSVGFTLIEIMAVVAVVAVLMAITLPGLRSARITSESTQCLINLASIAKLQASYSAGINGQWPNAFERDTQGQEWIFNNGGVASIITIAQADWWVGPLLVRGYYDRNEPTEGVTCPVVRRAWVNQPIDYSTNASYRYSPAMFTEAKLWSPDDPAAGQDRREVFGPDRYRKSVRIDEVKFPSHKVVMSEKEDNHGRGVLFGDPGLLDSERAMAKANVSFADGHVDRVEPYHAQEPLAINWRYDWLPNGMGAIPFSAAAWGYRGRDY